MDIGDVFIEKGGKLLHIVFSTDAHCVTSLPVLRKWLAEWSETPMDDQPDHAVGLETHLLVSVANQWTKATKAEARIAQRYVFTEAALTVLPVALELVVETA